MKKSFYPATLYSAGKSKAAKMVAAVTALVASGMAAAQDNVGTVIVTELTGGKAIVLSVIGAVAVILGVLILWSYIKRAR